jgi:predicted DNA-binding transcriptional regulator AlpA
MVTKSERPRLADAATRDDTLPPNPPDKRLLSKAEVCDRVGRTFVTLWQWMQKGKFPRARDVHGRPMWIESEVDAWIGSLPMRRLKGDNDAR